MTKYLITLILIFCSSSVFAQTSHYKDFAGIFDSLSDQNPFVPKLPQEIQKKPQELMQRGSEGVLPNAEGSLMSAEELLRAKIEFRNMFESKISLTGLVWDTDRPQAIINGNVVQVGDTLGDLNAKVMAIREGSVDLMVETELLTFTL